MIRAIRDVGPVDRALFQSVIADARPVVLRGLVADWPAVAEGRRGAAELARYLSAMDSGRTAGCVVGAPAIGARFFYRDDMTGFNFGRHDARVTDIVGQLLHQAATAEPLAIAMQSAPTDEVLPAFADANPMPLLPDVRPRIWIGNAIQVATHYDSNDNIACVVGGRRRFTLFPPDQIANLYVGPLEMTPAGAPVSMVDVEAPDLDRYPRFAQALEAAETAELAPGDAIYIPYFWWHAVRSLDPLSVLINYWWNDIREATSPLNTLLHGILAMSDLPEGRRAIWKGMFDHLVFHANGDPAGHLPEHVRGVFGTLTPEQRRDLTSHLARSLAGKP
ncbi:MAG: cupin-like domain-containing protein [Sphingomonas sp.]